MKRSKESILLEFSQILNLLYPQGHESKIDLDSKAFAGFFFDAMSSGIDQRELREYATTRWRGERGISNSTAERIASFVKSV